MFKVLPREGNAGLVLTGRGLLPSLGTLFSRLLVFFAMFSRYPRPLVRWHLAIHLLITPREADRLSLFDSLLNQLRRWDLFRFSPAGMLGSGHNLTPSGV